jgi:hypothetical protein
MECRETINSTAAMMSRSVKKADHISVPFGVIAVDASFVAIYPATG